MKRKNLSKIFCIAGIIFSSSTFAFFCPGNFNQINFGMTPDQVASTCGQPDDKKEYIKPNENVPQEWNYFIPQTVDMGGSSQFAQGTLKTSITFDDKGKAINITVNGIGVGSTNICGFNNIIQLGADKEQVKAACGDPSFINKQTLNANPTIPQGTKTIEFIYSSANPPATLVFENGVLTDRK